MTVEWRIGGDRSTYEATDGGEVRSGMVDFGTKTGALMAWAERVPERPVAGESA